MNEIKQQEILREMINLQKNQYRITLVIFILVSLLAAGFLLPIIFIIFSIIFKTPAID